MIVRSAFCKASSARPLRTRPSKQGRVNAGLKPPVIYLYGHRPSRQMIGWRVGKRGRANSRNKMHAHEEKLAFEESLTSLILEYLLFLLRRWVEEFVNWLLWTPTEGCIELLTVELC
ncbi:unnamed protein product [Protopolystoma xenopodis]|uniref:Uncharacterized protein n=1 Tax=Protopolystoma xenopodis TaxID=117903 RepID=A0A3S5BWK6_9PLAT|nr:unnamed protein product [Protopolystoma xenopodis]